MEDKYRITYGDRIGQEVDEDKDIFLMFPTGDVVLEKDIAAFFAEFPGLDTED